MKPEQSIKSIGQKIRAIRKSKRLSQEKLAELAGLHPTYISDIENGKVHASLVCYYQISQGLDIPLSELVSLSEGKVNQSFENDLGGLLSGLRSLPKKKQGMFLKAARGLLEGIKDSR